MMRVRKFGREYFIEVDHNLSREDANLLKKEIKEKNKRMPVRIIKNAHGTYDVFRREGSAMFMKEQG